MNSDYDRPNRTDDGTQKVVGIMSGKTYAFPVSNPEVYSEAGELLSEMRKNGFSEDDELTQACLVEQESEGAIDQQRIGEIQNNRVNSY